MTQHPYSSFLYASSLNHYGCALEIPEWGCSVLVREIGDGDQDATGVYPITIFRPDVDLEGGLQRLRNVGLISVVLILAEFHRPHLEQLEKFFDFVRPFKSHFIHRPQEANFSYSRHHRYELRRALKEVEVAPVSSSRDLSAWCQLYGELVARHKLSSLYVFPFKHHQTLFSNDGFRAIGAWKEGRLISCHIWAFHQDYAHSHLAATSIEGYRSGASYAVNDAAIHLFKNINIINFGGGAGYVDETENGLIRFKRGFANDTAQSYICGKIFNLSKYLELTEKRDISADGNFFPAYRTPKTEG